MLGESAFWLGVAAGLFIGGTISGLVMAAVCAGKRFDERFEPCELVDLNLDHGLRFYPSDYKEPDFDIAKAICCGEHCRTDTAHCHAVDHVREARRVRHWLTQRDLSSCHPLEKEDHHDAIRQSGGSR